MPLCIGLLAVTTALFAQVPDTTEVYQHWYQRVLPPKFAPKRISLNLRIDIRHSFVSEKPIIINGFNAGISFSKRHEVGLGIYWMTNESRDKFATQVLRRGRVINTIDSTSSESNLQFVSFFYRYSFFRNRWFDFAIPVEAGIGHMWTTTWNSRNQQMGGAQGAWLFPLQTGLYAELKATRWIGLMSTAGYRITIPNTVARQDYDGWYYSFGARIYIGYILRDLGIVKMKVAKPASPVR
jgi:hypothetical protein